MGFRAWIAVSGVLLAALSCTARAQDNTQAEVSEHQRKAQTYLEDKRPDLAIPEFQAIVKLDPANVDAMANLGVLLYFRGDYAQAAPDLRAALGMKPDLPQIRMLLGMAEKRLGDLTGATADLSQAWPKLTDAHMRLEAGLELIDVYTSSRQLEKAALVVAQLRDENPEDKQLLYMSYRLYSDLASESMLSLLLVAPDSAQMHAVIAHEDARQGNDPAAIAEYKKALAMDPKLPGGDFELAELLRRAPTESQRAAALQMFHAALEENPFDERSACELGDMEYDRIDFTQAKADYARALDIQPSSPFANLGMAKTLMALNQNAAAAPFLEKSIRLDPTNPQAHYRLALIYRHLGRTADAGKEMAEFQRLTKLKQKLQAVYQKMRLQPLEESGSSEKK